MLMGGTSKQGYNREGFSLGNGDLVIKMLAFTFFVPVSFFATWAASPGSGRLSRGRRCALV